MFVELSSTMNYKVKTFRADDLEQTENPSTKDEKLIMLSKIENKMIKTNKDIVFNNQSVFLGKQNGHDEFKYKTPNLDSTKYISIKTLNDNVLNILKHKHYLDINLVNAIYKNNTDLKFLIIGEKDGKNIFDFVNEAYFILYKTPDNKLKYRQIKGNIDALIKMRFLEARTSIGTNVSLEDLNEEAYQNIMISLNNDEFKDLSYNLLFNDFSTSLEQDITLNIFEDGSLSDIIKYSEDTILTGTARYLVILIQVARQCLNVSSLV